MSRHLCYHGLSNECELLHTVTSYERHGIWNHRQLDRLSSSLFMLTTRQWTSHYWPFVKVIIRLTNANWRCRKPFSQWQHSFEMKAALLLAALTLASASHRNGKAVRMTALAVTGDVEACLQRLQWRPGQSSWRPPRFCACLVGKTGQGADSNACPCHDVIMIFLWSGTDLKQRIFYRIEKKTMKITRSFTIIYVQLLPITGF